MFPLDRLDAAVTAGGRSLSLFGVGIADTRHRVEAVGPETGAKGERDDGRPASDHAAGDSARATSEPRPASPAPADRYVRREHG